MSRKSCIIKTVVLPPGVMLNDPRLLNGRVVEENQYVRKDVEIWNAGNETFEADIDRRLLPAAFKDSGHAHIIVYPNDKIKNGANFSFAQDE